MTTAHARFRRLCLALIGPLMVLCRLALAQTDPAAYSTIIEQPRHGVPIRILHTNAEVDDESIIQILFDTTKMAGPRSLVPNGPLRPQVQVRVEVYTSKGTSRSPVAPIPHYVDLLPAPAGSTSAGAEATTAGTIVYHDKYCNPSIGATTIPNTEFNLRGTQAGDADFIEIRVTNLMTQESLVTTLIPRKFGFRIKVTDSLMFIKRLGISTADRTAGIAAVNFAPSPGVTYGGTYYPRGNAILRFLQPGVGINVLFTKWGDPAFDVGSGQFVKGTSASDIQFGLGGQCSLFGDVLQFTYGANLNADQKRQYVGIGISFVNLTSKITSLISK